MPLSSEQLSCAIKHTASVSPPPMHPLWEAPSDSHISPAGFHSFQNSHSQETWQPHLGLHLPLCMLVLCVNLPNTLAQFKIIGFILIPIFIIKTISHTGKSCWQPTSPTNKCTINRRSFSGLCVFHANVLWGGGKGNAVVVYFVLWHLGSSSQPCAY